VKARKRWGRGVKRGGVGAEEGWEWKEKRRRREWKKKWWRWR
jgi:hypothetical protein